MIIVSWYRRKGHLSITINGHEPDAVEGSALVCCAVSVLGQGLIAALEDLAEDHPDKLRVEES